LGQIIKLFASRLPFIGYFEICAFLTCSNLIHVGNYEKKRL